ncbi:hypothetical protein C7445_102177 [Alicyclobacillus sacchari]|uniref:Uncharacterized protein n=1 Tax=Alicyclobacillus sacchari TaxID=392010 RepID=A0A4R8LSZ5_9BACL|nr:hypothetical protein [Alicyclobacillus sacchari]TDY50618.1 hypothetical protein C7445_102177 [Alicyclobacillus sacchari]GMA55578.1 hypothetical protein GCM10025858_00810 [Alicyclobacillus sacchari]GMA59184.1 hypothetical protein GCM10025858_36870 [Alicyclobacillus sacchari]
MLGFRRHRREREIAARLEELVQAVRDALDEHSKHTVQVTVQHLHVDQVALQELLFRVDSFDIDELSGTLNFGNNFGVGSPSSHGKKKQPSSPSGIAQTGTGFRVSLTDVTPDTASDT